MINTLILTTMMASGPTPAPTSIPAGMPYLHVIHLHAIDNLDKGDMLGKNRADFFAYVTVNGKTYKTEVMSKDDGYPDWKIPLDTSRRFNKIHIALMDDDGGLEAKDDHVDINPMKNHKDLIFRYDRNTGRMTGDVNGRFNQAKMVTGKGDDDKGSITFEITKSW